MIRTTRFFLAGLWLAAAAASAGPAEKSFDSIVERPAAWRVVWPGRITAAVDSRRTHGTPAALHLGLNKDLGDLKGEGVHHTPNLPFIWLELPRSLDLSRYTRLTFWVKIAGARHGHLHIALSTRPRLWGKGVKRTLNNCPLDAGDWSRYILSLGQIDAAERRAYRYLGIGSANVGHQPDEAPVTQVWIDDWRLSTAPIRKWQGWDADPTVVIVSQLGFKRFHQKLAVVNARCPAQTFVVRDAATGAAAFEGRLTLLRSAVGAYKIADFTRLTRPGRYVVEAGKLKSLPFRIGDDAYAPAIAMLSDWIFNMRCGCRTGLHGPCHLDDAVFVRYKGKGKNRREISRQHLDLVGGWHDAGDVRTYYTYTFKLTYRLLRARECGWRRDRDRDGVDDLLDSARWGMRHLPKVRCPDDGRFFFKIEDWPDFRRGNYWTDNQPGTHDDRHAMDFWKPEMEADAVGQAAASAGLFMRRAGKRFPRIAQAALDAVKARWAVWFDPESGRKRWREKPIHVHGHGNHMAMWGQGALQLYLVEKKPVYLEFARLCANNIMGYQRRLFYQAGSHRLCGAIFRWHRTSGDRDLPEEFLADLMLELPRDADYYRWRAALIRSAEWWMKRTRAYWRPFSVSSLEIPARNFKEGFFGVPLEIGADGKVNYYLAPAAGGLQLGDTAFAMQRLAQALNDIELERLARWQVQWAVGHNPFNVSWICGFGPDHISQYYSFSQGRMPGSVSTGFGIRNNGVPRCVRPDGGETSTTAGARLLRAMIAVSEPARLRLTLRRGGRPWTGPVRVRWSVNREIVFEGRTDAQGKLPEIRLDGGQRYELLADRAAWPFDAVSGTAYEGVVDLDHVLALRADAPARVRAGKPFSVVLRVRNAGLAAATTTIRAHAEDAAPGAAARVVTVKPGETAAISWPFTAGKARRPYVVFFEPDGDRLAGVDATGAIVR